LALYVTCEIAIIACDLAEVIGTAVALRLLFGIPLVAGAIITGVDALLVLLLMNRGFRALEAFVIALLLVIACCFAIEIAAVSPSIAAIAKGFAPSPQLVTDSGALYLAIGILGATVMPHNLYLHSSIVQTRDYRRTPEGRRDAIIWATTDSTIALMLALFVNAAILIIAAAVFHERGHHEVVEISQAFQLLSPLLGVGFASTMFAVALLASGINSTVTATLAGQIVMEGFLKLRLAPWARRLLTRSVAILPVIVVATLYDESATTDLLVFSQVILSLQLPFAVVPLVKFVTERRKMGDFVVAKGWGALAWAVAALIIVLDLKLVLDTVLG
jgi:manganese transport protein